jgi:hypothetical protein
VSTVQSELALAADLTGIRRVAPEHGWRVGRRTGLMVDVALTSMVDAESYTIRFVAAGYPDSAPSIKPVDPATGASDVRTAWPDCDGFRPTTDLCMPLSAEGYAVHPEWQNDPVLCWRSAGNPLLRVLEELQILLDNRARYRGRVR